MKEGNRISVVIPTLNEEENIARVLREIPKYIDEVIVVDGHSKDKTVEIARRYGVKVIFDDVGKGSALRKGMKNATGDIIIMMDADCSHIPEEMPLLIAGIESGYDICMGSRFIQGGGSEDITLLRKLGNKFFIFLVNLIWKMNYSDLCYGYRSLRKDCVEKLDLESDGFGIETEISIRAAKKGLRVLEVPSFEKKRHSGEGKLRTFRDGFVILKRIIRELFRD
ncbi:MAG: glycosyltransferase family 2 protein [Candidatus Altiarchaeales archaeon]|nr:MAG: glycosyltransferase family 2 protein [Candidatus Altiarchaeales archaeon]RLI94603.1 MAG: glycosyltransferase family 2 protein [Candidatus Altiarchaeales archaeon]HDO82857.1 glycosyltransferase family 2 protein [Candidatus Altiarchaeales archaeon]HEX55506.1 glycosyltransferase family 2 protein [Candidatus Altiarchaeales archaeon]